MILQDIKIFILFLLLIVINLFLVGCTACGIKNKTISKQIGGLESLYSISVSDAEKKSYEQIIISRKKMDGKSIPDVPFGYRNEDWNKFKSNIKNSDCLMFYKSDKESWDNLRGHLGYIVVRNGKVVDAFITQKN